MRQSKRLLVNMVVMSAVSVFLRFVGVSFHVYLSNRIGAAGMGLFQLISSVHLLAVTFAASGIRTATIRIIAEENGLRLRGGALKYCVGHALFFGFLAANTLYFSAPFIGEAWIGDARAILSLKILALTLPLIALSSVFGGYFVASNSPVLSSLSMFFEQFAKITVIVLILRRLVSPDIETSCAAIVTGAVAGEAAALASQLVMYLLCRTVTAFKREPMRSPLRRLLSVSLPLAVSAYARCALSTLEHMLIPRCLRRSGLSANAALADYGLINGMVFPVITFPLAFFVVYAELIMPEVTKAQVSGNERRIRLIAGRSLRLCLFFSVLIGAVFFVFAKPLGMLLYSSREAGRYIRLFAPLMPVMYLDTVTDGLLKGLGEHLASMRYNIADALISVVLVWTLLPRYATAAYVGMIYFTECFNFVLSLRRLAAVIPRGSISGAREDVRWLRALLK